MADSYSNLTRQIKAKGKPKANVKDAAPTNAAGPENSPSFVTFGATGLNGDGYALAIKEEELLDEGKKSQEEAKRLNVTYAGFGRWENKDHKVLFKTVDNNKSSERLVPLEAKPLGKGGDPSRPEAEPDKEASEPYHTKGRHKKGEIEDTVYQGPVENQPAKQPKEKKLHGGDYVEIKGKVFEQLMLEVDEIKAKKRDAASEAKAKGLKSDGHGAYTDAKGNPAGKVVNGELVTMNARGGVDAGADTLGQQLPNYTDYETGVAMTPAAKPDTEELAAMIKPAIPAKAPIGYDEYLRKIKRRNASIVVAPLDFGN